MDTPASPPVAPEIRPFLLLVMAENEFILTHAADFAEWMGTHGKSPGMTADIVRHDGAALRRYIKSLLGTEVSNSAGN